MGHESIVYGTITWDAPPADEVANMVAIAELPDVDGWPPLAQSMFAESGQLVGAGRYKSQTVHFAGSFKEIEWSWTAWLAKFERLLAELTFDDVFLHLRTELTVGDWDYRYEARSAVSSGPTQAWTFSGGPREFDYATRKHPHPDARWGYEAGVLSMLTD